jgi:hypothetical protein
VRAFRSGTNIAMEVALKGLAFARERSGNRDRSARGRTRSLGLKGARAGGVKSPGELPFYGLLGLRELTVELALRNGQWVWWMADNRPLSDNEADDRLKAALNALGEAPGVTVAADTALAAARKALSLLSLGLIAAGVKRELKA